VTTKTTTPTLQELILTRRILVCCGAGGVGKTTAATALALAAARRGRKVLALTIDPSKRLAETLGVERNLKTPVSMPEDRLVQAGIGPPGGLETWMLDPSLIAERVVKRFAKTPERAEQLARQVDTPTAQAAFMSGLGMPTIEVLGKLERELGKPARGFVEKTLAAADRKDLPLTRAECAQHLWRVLQFTGERAETLESKL
jgi:transcriptional regulator with XRE-family HTH domain